MHGAGRGNPFQANVLLLYLPKISENQEFSKVFMEYWKGTEIF